MEKIVKHRDGNNIEDTFPYVDEALANVKAKVQSLWSGAQSTRGKTWSRTKSFIQKHPGQAVGVAVLLGLVVGALLKSKGQD